MKTFATLSGSARHWTARAVEWADQYYDPAYDLLLEPPDADAKGPPPYHEIHTVRDSVWYTTGLFMRQQKGDVDRALRIIRAILRYQFDEPGRVYHGTFRRAPQEPTPPPNHAVEWRDYDPNWREFICCVFLIMLDEYAALLPDDLQAAMWTSIRRAAEGAFARRVPPHYTNIALMSALLLDYAGQRFEMPQWRAQGDLLARMIYAQFTRHSSTFWEYNSPTYYGVDLFALALWRDYGLNDDVFRAPGAAMEAELWRDIARFYHAGLRNLCGPYDRSYGMDMTHYLATLGLWVALVVPPDHAPLPDTSRIFGHSADFYFMPPSALLGAQVPDDALPHLLSFQGARSIEREIEPGRVATAWLSERVMIGASTAHHMRSGDSQFHGATVHWQTPGGGVGWIRMRTIGPVDARVENGRLSIHSPFAAALRFDIHAADLSADRIQADSWALPGLNLRVDAGDAVPEVTLEDGLLVVRLNTNGDCALSAE